MLSITVYCQEFIEREPGQVEDLLQLAIERPELGSLLSPHFIPHISNALYHCVLPGVYREGAGTGRRSTAAGYRETRAGRAAVPSLYTSAVPGQVCQPVHAAGGELTEEVTGAHVHAAD